jgi:4'-phosphopantetheinyl transferase
VATRYQLRCLHEEFVLTPSEVHVWFVDLRLDPESLFDLQRTLSADEEKRAQRFRSEVDKDRSIVSHGILRTLLARYTLQQPEQLSFSEGPNGKPALTPGSNDKDIQFNLAHSDDHALVAIATGREVGVDIERVIEQDDHERIARHFFSPIELASFLEYPDNQRTRFFFRHWVRKEAYLKARGFGLTRHEEGFDVPLTDAQVSIFAHADGTTWTAREILPLPGYAAAVVARGADWRLRSFD